MKPEEAIQELKDDYNTLGKGIPCDTGWGTAIDERINGYLGIGKANTKEAD